MTDHATVAPDGASPPRPAPLAGMRILDLSRVLAGPWCAMILGDLGADVIKVENPDGGDDTRHWGPPNVGGEAAYYLCTNRNKRSIAVDISRPEGQAIVRDIARTADAVIENYKLGTLERFGLDYASLATINPRIVYCSVSGYGRTGPRAALPGYDYVIQAEGGLMSVNGDKDGTPTKVGLPVADLFTGNMAAQAVLAALIAARRDGVGQHIDMALYDCQLAMLSNVGSAALISGREPARWGNQHPNVVPYQTFAASDRHIVIAVGNDRQFATLCALLDAREWASDPRFARNSDRAVNRDALIPLIAERIVERDAAHWLSLFAGAGVPVADVRGVHQTLMSQDATAREMVVHVDHPTIGQAPLVASPLKLSGTPVVRPVAPPLLGQHCDAILAELGWDAARIDAARTAGVVG